MVNMIGSRGGERKYGLEFSAKEVGRFRTQLVDAGFELIFNGVYERDVEASAAHRFGFKVYTPMGYFEGNNFFVGPVDRGSDKIMQIACIL